MMRHVAAFEALIREARRALAAGHMETCGELLKAIEAKHGAGGGRPAKVEKHSAGGGTMFSPAPQTRTSVAEEAGMSRRQAGFQGYRHESEPSPTLTSDTPAARAGADTRGAAGEPAGRHLGAGMDNPGNPGRENAHATT
jgi:hypothetical protein